jgi:predicted ATP-dependent endonuclease of OLD family
MQITRLEIVDFKRIEAAAIDCDGNPIILTGDNGQGKSSILDAIVYALQRTGTGKPIRDGQEGCTVALTIEGAEQTLHIKRRAKGENAYLDVTDAEGKKIPSPQKFLDALIGNLAFDPEAFTRLKAKEQADALRIATGLDTSDIDEAYKIAFSKRTDANRVKDNAEKVYNACPVAAGGKREKQSATNLITERDKLHKEVMEAEKSAELYEDAEEAIVEKHQLIQELEQKLAQARGDLAKLQGGQREHKIALEACIEATKGHSERLAAIDATLADLDAANTEADAHNRLLDDRAAKQESYKAAIAAAKALDDEVKRLVAEREERIAAAKMPIPGLSIEDDTVMLNNVPFADLNTAERIKVSAMIAMAQNPTLRVIFVREGALMSRANLAVLESLAKEHDQQLWIEKFQEQAGSEGLHIVEGLISQKDGKPAPAAEFALM